MVSCQDFVVNFLAISIILIGPTYLCYLPDVDSDSLFLVKSVENGTELEDSFTNITEPCSKPNSTLNMSLIGIGVNLDFDRYCSMKETYPFTIAMLILLKICLIYKGFKGYEGLTLVIVFTEFFYIIVSRTFYHLN